MHVGEIFKGVLVAGYCQFLIKWFPLKKGMGYINCGPPILFIVGVREFTGVIFT